LIQIKKHPFFEAAAALVATALPDTIKHNQGWRTNANRFSHPWSRCAGSVDIDPSFGLAERTTEPPAISPRGRTASMVRATRDLIIANLVAGNIRNSDTGYESSAR
jgi:hypothetical protein